MSEQRRKILLVTSIFPPEIGGPALYVENLQKQLIKRGFEVQVVTYTMGSGDIEVGGGSILRMWKLFVFLLRQKESYDTVVTFNTLSTGLPCALAARLLRKKKFLIRVGGDYLWERKGSGKTLKEYYTDGLPFSQRLVKSMIRFVLGSFEKIIVTTDWYKEVLKKEYGVKAKDTILIQNPFAEQAKQREERDDFYFFAGRLVPLKNPQVIIEAMTSVPDMKLSIAGEGPLESNLRILVDTLGLGERVTFLGKLSHEKMLETMARAKATVIPSLSEISPNTLLESIAAGTPVICTDECGYRENFDEVVSFFNPRSVEELVAQIRRHQDDAQYKEIEQKVQSFRIEQTWDTLVEAYQQIL
ncbi:glycosyltransferase family 4 protein [Candidatus Nomurabacteria bacterium]|nr:glycosyltransferase family 4 protein [Candidatus Nomurabacteria bacterium]